MNCLIIVGLSITWRRESEVKIRIRTYSDGITSIHQGAGGIEDYKISYQMTHSAVHNLHADEMVAMDLGVDLVPQHLF